MEQTNHKIAHAHVSELEFKSEEENETLQNSKELYRTGSESI